MALVSKSIPNLINGVSQQPAALRLESQAEVQENGFSDVVDGLKKRPPTKFLNKLKCVDPEDDVSDSTANVSTRATHDVPYLDKAFFHTYKRSDDEVYLIVITSVIQPYINYVGVQPKPKVLVYDEAGSLRYESNVASWDADGNWIAHNNDNTYYLPDYTDQYNRTSINRAKYYKDVTATSVADATFIVNKTKNIEQHTSYYAGYATSERGWLSHDTTKSLIYLKSVNYGRKYTVQLVNADGSDLADSSYTTPKQITDVTAGSGGDDQEINNDALKTSSVIHALRGIGSSSAVTAVYPSSTSDLPYFVLKANTDNYTIRVTDDDGGVNLKAFRKNAKSFTDLPNQCEDGFVVGVVGDNQKKEDDFYAKFEGEGGSGFWRECAAPNTVNSFLHTTMPHQLKQNSDLSFTFGQAPWENRKCGDENTNPFPSFTGSTITDVFFHRNRLGFLSGENVIFSGAGDYYNLFRTTVRTLLDSDPIDVAVSQNEVSTLKAAVPIQDNLLLFSSLNQFTLSAAQLLTPAEVTIEQSTKYECDLTAPPIAAGNSVFFATQSGGYAGVREFFTRETTEVKDATSVTSHVPEYIKEKIVQFAASANEDMLVARVDDENDSAERKKLYVYKWYNSSSERLQSAWSVWTFREEIKHIFFTNNLLYINFKDGTFEVLDVKYDKTEVLLDSQLEIDFVQQITDDYPSANLELVNSDGLSLGAFNPNNPTAEQSAALGSSSSNAVVGIPYTFKYQMSEQVFKPTQGDSTQLARFQLRKMSFNYNDTGHFDVTVDSVGRSPITSHFTGRVLDNQHNLLDQSAVIDDGSFQVGVQARATDTAITITNDSHLPSTFQSAEWEGYIVLRNQRL